MESVVLVEKKSVGQIYRIPVNDHQFFAYAIGGLIFVTKRSKSGGEEHVSPEDAYYTIIYNKLSDYLNENNS